jgi:hypothetical protein
MLTGKPKLFGYVALTYERRTHVPQRHDRGQRSVLDLAITWPTRLDVSNTQRLLVDVIGERSNF